MPFKNKFRFLFSLCLLTFFPFLGKSFFADIDVTHPNFYAIQYLQDKEIVQGYPRGDDFVFKPMQPVLRSEALKMLYLSTEKYVPKSDTTHFPDVPKEAWYARFVEKAVAEGVVKGFPDGTFHPEYTVTRAEFLKMMLEAFDAPVREKKSNEEWFQRYFDAAWEWKILSQSVLNPSEKMTRGQIAELLYRTKIVSLDRFSNPYVFTGFGQASYYGEDFAGRSTANGEIYNPEDLTAAHRTLPFGTYIKVTNGKKSVVVRVNDRGPYHNTRVIDLSRRAFSMLDSLSRGVQDVKFTVVSGPEKETISVPEYIREELTDTGRSEIVPDIIAEEVEDPTPRATEEQGRGLLFEETIPHLTKDFFPNATLRHTVPQIIPLGTVMEFSGRSNEYGYQTATVFLQNIDAPEKEQIHFTGKMSGKNFTFPVAFLKRGTYHIGLIFDDQKKSRVETIEVREMTRKRWFPATNTNFRSGLEIRVIPEEKQVAFTVPSSPQYVTRIDITQQQYTQTLYIENGLVDFQIPFEFFDIFNTNQTGTIKVSQALSEDGKLQNQISNWKETETQTFVFVEGFKDTEKEKIDVYDFPRYVHTLEPVTLTGRVVDTLTRLDKFAYLQTPSGFVKEVPIERFGYDGFRLEFSPEEWGTHVVQIIGENKETLFKRAIYWTQETVLPVKSWRQTPVKGDMGEATIVSWVNAVRYYYNLQPLITDPKLTAVAQDYANHLSQNNFIAHTSVTGETFKNRLQSKGFVGEFGENLSLGKNLEQALWGLENSMAHRKNILTRKWKNIGIGLAHGKKGVYVVQIFSR